MDPVSALKIASTALSIAQGAFQVGQQLYTFIQDVRHQDETAEAFADEIQSLGTACTLVSNRVRRIVEELRGRAA